MTYHGIVCISNDIRFVLDTARQVNLTSQNASFAARRAGNAKGFQAVSVELKKFSQLLAAAMSGMSGNILEIAREVSGTYKEARCSRLFNYTRKMLEGDGVLQNARQRVHTRQKNGLALLKSRIHDLDIQITKSLGICNSGRALARSAMIEATHGAELEYMLRNVAQDIERTIDLIHARLKSIDSHLRSEQEEV